MNRRTVVKLMVGGAGVSVLAACGVAPQAPAAPTAAPAAAAPAATGGAAPTSAPTSAAAAQPTATTVVVSPGKHVGPDHPAAEDRRHVASGVLPR